MSGLRVVAPQDQIPRLTEAETRFLAMLGTRIRLLRTARRWSQELLAQRSGLTRNAVSAIERADCDVTVVRAARLAAAFGMSLPELVDPSAEATASGLVAAARGVGREDDG